MKSKELAPSDFRTGNKNWGVGGDKRWGERIHATDQLLGECVCKTESDLYSERERKNERAANSCNKYHILPSIPVTQLVPSDG